MAAKHDCAVFAGIRQPIYSKVIVSHRLTGQRIRYYNNSDASFRRRIVLLDDVELNPGPV
jgi:hypothetical protein